MKNTVQFVDISENDAGQRLDNYLIKVLKGAPKSLIYRIIRKGEVRINKGRAKPETRLNEGDCVRIPPVRTSDKVEHRPGQGLVSVLENAVLFENDELLVFDKPSGLAVHGGSGVNLGLIEALRSVRGSEYLELVHRLDKETSGCVMIAKKRSMLTYLQDLLREQGRIQKRYIALVKGKWPKRKQHVTAPLWKQEARGGERIVEVDLNKGKASRTEFDVLDYFTECTLVRAQPVTGRTHQIRVHALSVGCPLVGDEKYGDESFNREMRNLGVKRLFLHAESLQVPLQDGREIEIKAALPEDLHSSVQKLVKLN